MLIAIFVSVVVFFITITLMLFRIVSLLIDIKETKLYYERILNEEKWV
jgi:hypothetical protein|tara:strand:- start:1029 stop:1172 length:144 start_codon:yes stop_codon:yes gene_type:complete